MSGIVYYSPSIFFGNAVKYLKNKFNCFSYLILRDLFPQWSVDVGLIKKNSTDLIKGDDKKYDLVKCSNCTEYIDLSNDEYAKIDNDYFCSNECSINYL